MQWLYYHGIDTYNENHTKLALVSPRIYIVMVEAYVHGCMILKSPQSPMSQPFHNCLYHKITWGTGLFENTKKIPNTCVYTLLHNIN